MLKKGLLKVPTLRWILPTARRRIQWPIGKFQRSVRKSDGPLEDSNVTSEVPTLRWILPMARRRIQCSVGKFQRHAGRFQCSVGFFQRLVGESNAPLESSNAT